MSARFLLWRLCATSTAASSKLLTSRTFANAAKKNEELKGNFKRDVKREIALLAFMVAAGAVGVHFYQHRENAPVNQVKRLIKQAEQSSKEVRKSVAFHTNSCKCDAGLILYK